MILHQNVLITEGYRSLAFREQPSLPQKRKRKYKETEDNNDRTRPCALNGITARQGFALAFIAISIIFRNWISSAEAFKGKGNCFWATDHSSLEGL